MTEDQEIGSKPGAASEPGPEAEREPAATPAAGRALEPGPGTEPEPDAAPEAFEWEPRGRPVQWALGAVATVVVVCFGSIWFGAVTPRVGTQPVAIGDEAVVTTGDRVVALAFEVTNQAHSDATLLGAGETVPGLRLVSTELSRPSGMPLGERPRLSSGETALVTLRYEVTNCWAVDDHPERVPVHVRTMLGMDRTVDGPRVWESDHTGETPWTISVAQRVC